MIPGIVEPSFCSRRCRSRPDIPPRCTSGSSPIEDDCGGDAPIAERADRERSYYSWESRVSTGQSATVQPAEIDDGVVIVEETHLRWLQWERPEEVRFGAVVGGVPPTAVLDRWLA